MATAATTTTKPNLTGNGTIAQVIGAAQAAETPPTIEGH